MIESAAVVAQPSTRAPAFRYQPALDGVRALAVSVVLLFHAGFSWMSGGYIGVSVFFTLSGYLITSLAIAEHERTGRFGLGAFYARRLRRLLPASLLCLGLVVVAARLGGFDGVADLRGDVLGAVAQIYNWVALAGGESYADQVAAFLGQSSPVAHYWSLAIEEQFYVLWPLALVLVLRRPRRLASIAAMTAASAVLTVFVVLRWGSEAAYLATPARLVELLAGALLAAVLAPTASMPNRSPFGVDRLLGGRLAGGALAVLAVLAVTLPAAGGPAYHGGFIAVAAVSAALIAGLQRPSAITRALSARPLVQLGRISYGVYLFHWPIFVLVDERRLDLPALPLFAVRAALTVALAAISFRWWEQPIRRRTVPLRLAFPAAVAGALVVAGLAVTLPQHDEQAVDPDTAQWQAALIEAPPADGVLAPLGERPLRIAVAGDSVAWSASDGLVRWALDHPDELQVSSAAGIGCGVDVSGIPIDDAFSEPCLGRMARLREIVDLRAPDVVMILVTFRDLQDRAWSAAEGELAITDERYQRHLFDAYVQLTEELLAGGAGAVSWAVPPRPDPLADPVEFAIYQDLVRSVGAHFAGDRRVSVLEIDEWLGAQSDPPRRNDGLHWSHDGAYELAERFLVPQLDAAARRAAS